MSKRSIHWFKSDGITLYEPLPYLPDRDPITYMLNLLKNTFYIMYLDVANRKGALESIKAQLIEVLLHV